MSVKLERILRIYNRLRRGPVTIEVISLWAKNAGISVSDRQLYRDLNALTRLKIADGENVVDFTDEKNRKVWKLEYEESSSLTQYDLNSFFLFRNFIPFTIHEHRKSSFEKLEQILYRSLSRNRYQQYVEANELFLNRSNFQESLYGEDEHNKIEDLLWAVQNKRMIVVEDDRLNAARIQLPPEPFPLTLLPLELLFHRGKVYLCGLDNSYKKYVAFAISRTLMFRLTNDGFDHKKYWPVYQKLINKNFGIAEPINPKAYQVKAEFDELLAESLKNQFWHPTQQWKQLPNGNYLFMVKCGISEELIGFLSQWPGQVKVLQPQLLVELMVKKHRDSIEIHEVQLKEKVAAD